MSASQAVRAPSIREASCLMVAILSGALGDRPVSAQQSAPARIAFERVTNSGVDFVVEPNRTEQNHQPETMISGVALFDYDNDGRLDIYILSGATMPGLQKTRPEHTNRLFRNLGDWKFEDVTERAGVQGRGYTHGVAVADYDADGNQDIFVAGLRENILYRNRGDGRFEDVTSKAGLNAPDPQYGTLWSVGGAFLDYDRDGVLDLFVSNYCVWDPDEEPTCGPSGTRDYCHPKHYEGLPNSLFRGQGDGTFEDVSEASGLRAHVGKGMGLGIADFDQDGWIDVYVANDSVPAFYFHNRADGTYEELGFESGSAYTFYGAAVSGMGVDARDIDNDGLPDIFVAAMTNEAFPLYLNVGKNNFDEATDRSRLAMLTRKRTGWGAGIYDFNNDGWKDIFVASGDVMDPEGISADRVPQPNTLLVNLGDGTFADAGSGAGAEFRDRKAVHRGAAFGDIDDDGRVDAVVTALSGETELWHNVTPTTHHWLLVSALGSGGNLDALGTRISVTAASGTQHNHVNTAVGYGGASDRRVHFGLGNDAVVARMDIVWPSGKTLTRTNVEADQILTIREPE